MPDNFIATIERYSAVSDYWPSSAVVLLILLLLLQHINCSTLILFEFCELAFLENFNDLNRLYWRSL